MHLYIFLSRGIYVNMLYCNWPLVLWKTLQSNLNAPWRLLSHSVAFSSTDLLLHPRWYCSVCACLGWNPKSLPQVKAKCCVPVWIHFHTVASLQGTTEERDNPKSWRRHSQSTVGDNVWAKFACAHRINLGSHLLLFHVGAQKATAHVGF